MLGSSSAMRTTRTYGLRLSTSATVIELATSAINAVADADDDSALTASLLHPIRGLLYKPEQTAILPAHERRRGESASTGDIAYAFPSGQQSRPQLIAFAMPKRFIDNVL